MVLRKIRIIGNSYNITIPEAFINILKASDGDKLKIDINIEKSIVEISNPKRG